MEYNLVKLEELNRLTPKAEDGDLILVSSLATGTYQSTHMTVKDAFGTLNIRLDGATRSSFRNLRDTSCIDLDIDESTLQTQKDANQAILDIFNTFGSEICELQDAISDPFVIIQPDEPDTTDLSDGWLWADSSGYTGYDLYVLDNGTWVPVSSASEGQQGEPGEPGEDGKSAYEIWLEQGNIGTEQDFLDSLKGEDGDPGTNGIDGRTPTVNAGPTETLPPGSPALVTNIGNNINAVFKFDIPEGEKGETGPSEVDLQYFEFKNKGEIEPQLNNLKIGDRAVIPLVTSAHAGLMSPDQKEKLEDLTEAINFKGVIDVTNIDPNNGGIPYPSPLENGDLYVNVGDGVAIAEYVGIEGTDVVGNELCIWDEGDAKWEIIGNTNVDLELHLDYIPSPSDGLITNTGGDDARVTHVTSTLAGLMLPEDKIKLDSIPTDAYDGSALIEFEQSDWEETDIDSPAYIHNKPDINLDYTKKVDEGIVTNTAGDDATIPLVDDTYAGLMSPEDKALLDSLVEDAYEPDDLEERVELLEDNLELTMSLEFKNDNDLAYFRTLITKKEYSEFAHFEWKWEIDTNGDGTVNFTITKDGDDIPQNDKDQLGYVDASSYLLRFDHTDFITFQNAKVRYTGTLTFGETLEGDVNEIERVALDGGDQWISPWGTP